MTSRYVVALNDPDEDGFIMLMSVEKHIYGAFMFRIRLQDNEFVNGTLMVYGEVYTSKYMVQDGIIIEKWDVENNIAGSKAKYTKITSSNDAMTIVDARTGFIYGKMYRYMFHY